MVVLEIKKNELSEKYIWVYMPDGEYSMYYSDGQEYETMEKAIKAFLEKLYQ